MYNVIDEINDYFGSDWIDNYTWDMYTSNDPVYFKGLFLGNGIVVSGEPNTIICANYSGSNVFKDAFSIFHAYNNRFSVDNLQIEGTNVRYCIHDDSYISNGDNVSSIKNCKLVDHGNTFKACIGGGFSVGDEIKYIVNNEFYSINGTAFFYHTNPNSGSCEVKAFNNLMDSCTCHINAYGSSSKYGILKVSNSTCNKEPYKKKNSDEDTDNVLLKAWCNEIK